MRLAATCACLAAFPRECAPCAATSSICRASCRPERYSGAGQHAGLLGKLPGAHMPLCIALCTARSRNSLYLHVRDGSETKLGTHLVCRRSIEHDAQLAGLHHPPHALRCVLRGLHHNGLQGRVPPFRKPWASFAFVSCAWSRACPARPAHRPERLRSIDILRQDELPNGEGVEREVVVCLQPVRLGAAWEAMPTSVRPASQRRSPGSACVGALHCTSAVAPAAALACSAC